MKTIEQLSQSFWIWCNSFGKSFRNSPDALNVREWARMYNADITEDQYERVAAAVRRLRTPSISEPQPTIESENEEMQKRNRASHKAVGPTLLKELNPDGFQGKLVGDILTKGRIRRADLCDEYMIDEHIVMTTLNLIARQTGIGYDVVDGIVSLTLPKGITDPFEL